MYTNYGGWVTAGDEEGEGQGARACGITEDDVYSEKEITTIDLTK